MRENLVTKKTLQLAQSKGFNVIQRITTVYDENTPEETQLDECGVTQSLLQKWLREEHNFDIQIFCFNYLDNGKFYVFNIFQARELDDISGEYNTYEDALEDALFTALKNLK